jgi:multisubunit Na+/H+ antiporter MnhG subunit
MNGNLIIVFIAMTVIGVSNYGASSSTGFPILFTPLVTGLTSAMVFFWSTWRPLVKTTSAIGFILLNDLLIRLYAGYRCDTEALSWVALFMAIGVGISLIELLFYLFWNHDEISNTEILACISVFIGLPVGYLYLVLNQGIL